MVKALADRYLSLEEVAEYLHVSRDVIYKWIESKGIPCHKIGRLWRFQKTEIDKWVKSGSASKPRKSRKE